MLPLLLAAGAAGGIGSMMSGNAQADRYKGAMDGYNAGMGKALAQYQSGSQEALDKYGIDSQNYLNTPSGVNAWLNPAMDYQMQQAANANNMQYAAGGKMNSGAAMKALQDRSQNIAKLSWQDAFNNMNASNAQGLSNLQFGTQNQLDLNGNMFNARQGMLGNQLSGGMNAPAGGGVGAFMSGLADGLGAGASIMNATSGGAKK